MKVTDGILQKYPIRGVGYLSIYHISIVPDMPTPRWAFRRIYDKSYDMRWQK